VRWSPKMLFGRRFPALLGDMERGRGPARHMLSHRLRTPGMLADGSGVGKSSRADVFGLRALRHRPISALAAGAECFGAPTGKERGRNARGWRVGRFSVPELFEMKLEWRMPLEQGGAAYKITGPVGRGAKRQRPSDHRQHELNASVGARFKTSGLFEILYERRDMRAVWSISMDGRSGISVS
jgi:hypothetical protein